MATRTYPYTLTPVHGPFTADKVSGAADGMGSFGDATRALVGSGLLQPDLICGMTLALISDQPSFRGPTPRTDGKVSDPLLFLRRGAEAFKSGTSSFTYDHFDLQSWQSDAATQQIELVAFNVNVHELPHERVANARRSAHSAHESKKSQPTRV